MLNKANINNFRSIKYQMIDLLQSNNFDENKDISASIITNYLSLQSKLLSLDLSIIPFEDWEGLVIFAEDKIIDFSNTGANIDFALVDITGECIFINCNVRNVDKYLYRNNENFNKDLVDSSDYFIDSSLDKGFRKKYYLNELSIDEVMVLSKNDLKKLDLRSLLSHVKINILFKRFGYKKLREIYDFSKEEFYKINGYLDEYIVNNDVKSIGNEAIKNVVFDNDELLNNFSYEMLVDFPKVRLLLNKMSPNEIEEFIERYRKVFNYLRKVNGIEEFSNYYKSLYGFDENIYRAIIEYYLTSNKVTMYSNTLEKKYDIDDNSKFVLPDYLSELNIKIIETINSIDDLKDYDYKTLIIDSSFRHLINKIGIDSFINLYNLYSSYLLISELSFLDELVNEDATYDEICCFVEDYLIDLFSKRIKPYDEVNAPMFLKVKREDLFLSNDAPIELKNVFYSTSHKLTFDFLSNNKSYVSYLRGKDFLYCFNYEDINELKLYFDNIGYYEGLVIGSNKPKTVDNMIINNKVNVLIKWYNKSGRLFIPDYYVMDLLKYEDINKYLINSSNFDKLMKLDSYSKDITSIIAMFKLAYSFGVFDSDYVGYNLLINILSGLKERINNKEYDKLINLENKIIESNYSSEAVNSKVLEYYKYLKDLYGSFSNIYVLDNEDYIINKAIYDDKDSIRYMRYILENESIVINKTRLISICNNFDIVYDKDFKYFFIDNIDNIINNTSVIGIIEKNYSLIKNDDITWDYVVSNIDKYKYVNNESNEEEIITINNYDNSIIDKINQIYEYGKLRSNIIPEIQEIKYDINYEITCFSSLNNMSIDLKRTCNSLGELFVPCMDHNLLYNHGRLFTIKDDFDNVVSQNWVYRDNTSICFNNVINNNVESNTISYKLLELYNDINDNIKLKDEKVFNELKNSGYIDNADYIGLLLTKLTLNSFIEGDVKYEPFVKINKNSYLSSSIYKKKKVSIEQNYFIKYAGDFNLNQILVLQRLEVETKKEKDLVLPVVETDDDFNSLLCEAYDVYGEIKIAIGNDFAIVYIDGEEIEIIDLLYNLNDKINTLTKLNRALLEICKDGKEINLEKLSFEQTEIFNESFIYGKE